MTEEQSTLKDEQSPITCHFCGEVKKQLFEDVCPECIEKTLLKYLPKLKRVLEDKYGEWLDRWLSIGNLNDVEWMVEDKFNISPLLIRSFLKKVVQGAVEHEEIMLCLAREEFWKPIETEELMEYVYRSCVDELQQSIKESITKAFRSAPTLTTEREIIEIASGKRCCPKRYLREEAIFTLIYTRAFELPWPMEVLINLRYKQDKGKFPYTEMLEARINPVWEEVEKILPKELVKLIDKDEPL
jgi:hypothetical protein